MAVHLEVRRGAYADSVALMQVSQRVASVEGVEAALVAMATELNLDLLSGMGFPPADAGPNDLVVAVRAGDDDALAAALTELEAALAPTRARRDGGGGQVAAPRSVRDGAGRGGTLALVSVPGEHAFVEAMEALEAGLDVLVFSDNVPLEREVVLKRRAGELGRLVMGPDAGTAIVAGVGLGFANVVRPGPVGIVAASGTGAQQLTCLLDEAGAGVSHVLGVGGRDLKDAVGGLATLQALALLDADPATELIVLLSKPPEPRAAERVRAAAAACRTPVLTGFLGEEDLTALAARVLDRLGRATPAYPAWGVEDEDDPTDDDLEPRPAGPGRLVGLFAGGTLAAEAALIVRAALPEAELRGNVVGLASPSPSDAPGTHLVLDLGEDDYTVGRAHPMIDQQLRLEAIARECDDATTRVLLVDVVLGHGAHEDPAAELAPVLQRARARAEAAGRALDVVVSLCGTAGDPQDRAAQAARLTGVGALVWLSNAQAARAAVAIARGGAA